MARLSTRFSRYFSLSSRRSRSTTSPKLSKSKISKPIVAGEEDTHPLTTSSHADTHSHSSSVYTISDEELRSMEERKLGRRIEDDIDSIIASYQHVPPTATADPFCDTRIHSTIAPPLPSSNYSSPSPPSVYSSPTPSSTYSSPPSTPPTTMKAKLERFRDTPPPAPG